MSAPDPCTWTATDVLAAMDRRELSAREYATALLARIERHNGALGLVVTLDAERALAEADRCDDERARGQRRGPLHGLAMTVKDSLETAGLRTTSGAPEYAGHVPTQDADPVARVRAAGAIVLGKTNLPIHAADVQSYNDLFGVARNPWSPAHTTGGSSGGSAGAVAAGFTPLEIGSDIAGSIRIPASHCGVVGHRPTFGIVSAHGQIPGPPGTLTQADLAVIGPFARSARDAELLLDVIAGPDAANAVAWRLALPPARPIRKVAAWFDDEHCPVATEVQTLLHEAADRLEASGVVVDRSARPPRPLAYHDAVYRQLLGAALAGSFTPSEVEARAAHRADVPDDPMDELLGSDYAHLRHRAWLSANERRLQLRRQWRTFFTEWDAILLPSLCVAPIPHDTSEPPGERTIVVDGVRRRYWDQITWPGLTALTGLPTTVAPAGRTVDGRPVGVAITGPWLEDRTTLAVADRLVGPGGVDLAPLA